MPRLIHLGLIACLALPGLVPVSPAAAQPTATAPATRPATQPTKRPMLIVHDPDLDALLDRVDAAASELDTLDADLVYETEQGLLGDVQKRSGRLVYARGDDATPQRMAVVLKVLVTDNRGRRIDQRYVFDGTHWVKIDGDARQWTRYPASSDADGHPVTEMLPSNFDRDALLTKYHVERRAVEGSEPDPTPTIRLRPRTADGEFDHADVTFDERATPVTVEMKDGGKTTRLRLLNVERNGAVDEAMLEADPPTEQGWSIDDRSAE